MRSSFTLMTNTPPFFSEIAEVIRLFFGAADIAPSDGDADFTHRHEETADVFRDTFTYGGHSLTNEMPAVYGGLAEKKIKKRAVKTACFRLLAEVTGASPPWGSLTGIRPTRVYYEALSEGMSASEAEAALRETFFVSEEKVSLLSEIISAQRGLIDIPPDAFDVYIGIPFCKTRCSYCSFPSGEIGDGARTDAYLAALSREIDACADITRLLNLRPRAVYVGGGTPTSIPADSLNALLLRAQSAFPGAPEWTVEAGRPDTIDEEMLDMLKERGIGRISINPQTFNDDTLRRIGRAHTSEDTERAFMLARRMGFENVNMDLIAALPGEDEDDFMKTLQKTRSLCPESVTVHTLAVKRASRLNEAGYDADACGAAARMVDAARGVLTENGYRPYYIYRQKYMAGNLENVGYAKEGKACLYNVDNMEEITPVLALGAGAITKWLFPRELRIERAPNVKNVDQYIGRVGEMIERKRALMNKR